MQATRQTTRLPVADAFADATIGMAYVGQDGRLLQVNAALCAILGRTTHELLGARWSELTAPGARRADSSNAFPAGALIGGDGRAVHLERRLVRGDGGVVVARITSLEVDRDGTPSHFVQVEDVTENQLLLRSALTIERRLRTVLKSSVDAIFWLRVAPSGSFRYVNDAAVALTGYDAAEFAADPELFDRIVHPDDRAAFEPLTRGAGGPQLLRWVRRDTSLRWVELRSSVIAEQNGQVSDVLGVVRDVTDRIAGKHHEARRTAQQRAVADLARTCAGAADVGDVIEEAVAVATALCLADAVAVWLECEPGGGFHLATQRGLAPGAEDEDERTVQAGASHSGIVRATGMPVRLGAADLDPWLAAAGVASGIAVPIRADGRIVGALATYVVHGDIGDGDTVFLQALAATLGACSTRQQLHEELTHERLHDAGTGLASRELLAGQLRAALVAPPHGEVVLAICAIEDFALLEEAFGHDAAEEVRRGVARRIAAVAAPAGAGYLDGGKFAVLFSGQSAASAAAAFSSGIVAAMRASLPATALTVSLSVGVVDCSGLAPDGDLLATARDALLRTGRATRSARGLAPSNPEAARHRLDLVAELRSAVAAGEITAYFQPVVALRTGDVIGFEALARWRRGDGTFVTPAEFIPLAEDIGLIADLGQSMLEQAGAFLRRATDDGARLTVTVNVSSYQLDDPWFAARVDDVISRYALEPGALCLELTESSLTLGDATTLGRIEVLKRAGATLAIDDFGTGYSSLAYLTQFPVDLLKIDRAFVSGLQDDHRRIAVVHAIISLAHTLALKVVAEGVEDRDELDVLTGLGCEFAQGFHWSPAVPATAALQMCRDADRARVPSFVA